MRLRSAERAARVKPQRAVDVAVTIAFGTCAQHRQLALVCAEAGGIEEPAHRFGWNADVKLGAGVLTRPGGARRFELDRIAKPARSRRCSAGIRLRNGCDREHWLGRSLT